MTKFKEIKNLHNIFIEHINDLDLQLQLQLKKIKHEYNNNLTDEKIKLLLMICEGENLDFNKIKNKYLKIKDLNNSSINNSNSEININEDLLDKIEIDDTEYYYEKKENGKVYDKELNVVGVFINNEIKLQKEIV
jgi:hypothetical protein|uniref:Uncharacterized protein n=1 Tax=viral metagenome TaxID=1070528 RepID=A0A6C0EC47_9ZZZZ